MPDPALELVGIDKISSVDYLNSVMACYAQGRVAVPIDAGASAPAGHAFAERLSPAAGGGWFTLHQSPIHSDAPAQVSFSSGTTGEPKAILLSHRALADVTDRLIEAMAIDGEISEYLGVPATYSFGLARARVSAAVGGRLFVPDHGFNPVELAAMLDADEVNALSAVPTLLRVLIANPGAIPKKIGRRLRWLEIGSQPMSAEEKQAVRRIFPAARIIQHYGLTEASRTTFLDIQEASDAQLATVGRPIGKTRIKIDHDKHICIKGPHVADGILTAQGLVPIVDADGWLRTQDLGSIDADGFLTFEGRADDLLNIGGIKVPAELFERKLGALLGADATHVAVTSRPDALRGETVMIASLRQVPMAALVAHAQTVGAEFGLGNADLCVVQVDEIPRTETGKIRRAALAEQAAAAMTAEAATPAPDAEAAPDDGETPRAGRESEIARIWCEALRIAAIGRNDSFFARGGDSLSAITAVLAMESAGLPSALAQQIFQNRTIAQIAASEGGSAPVPTATGATNNDAPRPGRESEIARIWCQALSLPAIGRNDSFFGKCGDSLSAITTVLAMEAAGMPSALGQQIFQGRTIAQIAASENGRAAEISAPDAGEAEFQPFTESPKAKAPPLHDGSFNNNPPGIGFWALVAEDYRTNDSDLFSQGFQMLLVHRFGNWRMGVRTKLLRAPLTIIYRFLNKMTQYVCGMKLDYVVPVGRRVRLDHFGGMMFGARSIGNDVTLRQNTTFGISSPDDPNAKPIIGDCVDIGAGVVIVGNVTIGENSVIGPNSVVLADVPPHSIVMGVPGRVIGPNRKHNRGYVPRTPD